MSTNLELEILYRISQAIAHSQDVNALLEASLDILDVEMGFERGTITLKHPDEESLQIITSKGLTDKEVERGKYDFGEGITGEVAASKEPMIIPNISKEPRFLGRTKAKRDLNRSFICVPIIH